MAVTFTTTGSTFEPVIELVPGSTATVTWTCPTFPNETGVTPTFAFGSAATRTVTMTVTGGGGPGDVVMVNCGYDDNFDVGNFMPSSAYAKPAEAITGIGNINELTGLRYLLADYTALAGSLDLTGMSALMYLQLSLTNVSGLNLTGCTSLVRLQAEGANLSTLNLNPVAANLRDLRAATQQGNTLTLTPMSNPLPLLYHYCVRDQFLINSIPLDMMPALEEYWAWNCRITGVLDANGSTTLRDVRAYSNRYTSLDFSGCSALNYVEMNFNVLGSAAVDQVLADINALGTSGGFLDLRINTAPSAAGLASRTALIGRGWTVNVNSAASGVISVVQTEGNAVSGFANPIGAGNSLVMVICVANAAGNPITSHSPLLGGYPTDIAVKLQEKLVQVPGGPSCYHAIWLWPHCSDGSVNGFGLTIDNGGGFSLAEWTIEVAGLGVTPQIDVESSASHPTSTAVNSGTTSPTRSARTFVVGTMQTWAGASGSPTGYTMLTGGANGKVGYRLPTASSTFSFARTASGAGPWTAGVMALAASVPTPVGSWGIPI